MMKLSETPRVVAVMPLWRRPHLLPMIIEKLPDWLHGIVYILSPEDPYITSLLEIVKSTRCDYRVEIFMNKPLGRKLNHGVRTAMNEFEFDYLMNIGSDDIIHPDLLKEYRRQLDMLGIDGWPDMCMMGMNSGDWYDPNNRRAERIRYFDVPIIIGAGRLTHISLLDLCDGYMNNPLKSQSLDTDSQIQLVGKYDAKGYLFKMEGYVVDIKTGDNINKFDLIYNENSSIEHWPLDESYLLRHYGI